MTMLSLDELTWTCHVCGEERPDGDISVRSTEITPSHPRLVRYTVCQNVRYCNDRAACVEGSKHVRFIR